jgi:hypothetical protein
METVSNVLALGESRRNTCLLLCGRSRRAAGEVLCFQFIGSGIASIAVRASSAINHRFEVSLVGFADRLFRGAVFYTFAVSEKSHSSRAPPAALSSRCPTALSICNSKVLRKRRLGCSKQLQSGCCRARVMATYWR